jgi:hypothetical protein
MTTHDYAYWLFEATDRECGLACMLVPVPPTIDMSDEFREVYCQAFRHSLRDARAAQRCRPRNGRQRRRAGSWRITSVIGHVGSLRVIVERVTDERLRAEENTH